MTLLTRHRSTLIQAALIAVYAAISWAAVRAGYDWSAQTWLAFGASYFYILYAAVLAGRRMPRTPEYADEVWQVRAAMVSGIVVSLVVIAALVVAAASAVSSWF